MQVRDLRALNTQAEEMLKRAKALSAQSEAATNQADKERLNRRRTSGRERPGNSPEPSTD
jgi:hypothetical protein